MCGFAATAGFILNTAGSYMSQQAAAQAAQESMNAQARAAITQMNYKFQGYEAERTNAFDRAVNELIKTERSYMELNSGVRAAINEEAQGGGRTAHLLMRSAEGDKAATTASIKDNYQIKSNEIDLNKESTLLSTKATIDNINASAPQMPSRFANFLSVAGIALNSYTTGQTERQNRKNYEIRGK